MKISTIVKYPFNFLEKTWIGDLAKIIRVAYTPLTDVRKDSFVRRHRLSHSEIKTGIKGFMTAKDLAIIKKRVLEHDFRP